MRVQNAGDQESYTLDADQVLLRVQCLGNGVLSENPNIDMSVDILPTQVRNDIIAWSGSDVWTELNIKIEKGRKLYFQTGSSLGNGYCQLIFDDPLPI